VRSLPDHWLPGGKD